MRLLSVLIALTFVAVPIAAQDATIIPSEAPGSVYGFSAALSLGGTALSMEETRIRDEDDPRYSGFGINLGLSYGLSERFDAFAEMGAYDLDLEKGINANNGFAETGSISQIDLGGRIYFTNAMSKTRPYVLLALSRRTFVSKVSNGSRSGNGLAFEETLRSNALTYGLGLRSFVGPVWVLSIHLTNSNGTFTDGEFKIIRDPQGLLSRAELNDFSIDATALRLHLGMAWYIGRIGL